MEIYKYIELNNGDILLEKIIINTMNYNIINKSNGDKILKRNYNIIIKNKGNIDEIRKYDLTKSVVLECIINNTKINKLKYKTILIDIYKIINDGVKIIKHANLNIKTKKKENEGFYYLNTIGISIQAVDSNRTLFEIINQCFENNIKLSIKIKCLDESIINIFI